jgi:hypothetical protein
MAKEFNQKSLDKLVAVIKKSGLGQSETFYVNETGIERAQIARYLYPAELKAHPELKIPATGKAIVKARNEGIRWPRIAVRTGISESKAKELFEAESGMSSTESYTGRGRKTFDGSSAGTTSKAKRGAKTKTAPAAASGRRGRSSDASKPAAPAAGKRGRRSTRGARSADPK